MLSRKLNGPDGCKQAVASNADKGNKFEKALEAFQLDVEGVPEFLVQKQLRLVPVALQVVDDEPAERDREGE